jgi:hypothetical protein
MADRLRVADPGRFDGVWAQRRSGERLSLRLASPPLTPHAIDELFVVDHVAPLDRHLATCCDRLDDLELLKLHSDSPLSGMKITRIELQGQSQIRQGQSVRPKPLDLFDGTMSPLDHGPIAERLRVEVERSLVGINPAIRIGHSLME